MPSCRHPTIHPSDKELGSLKGLQTANTTKPCTEVQAFYKRGPPAPRNSLHLGQWFANAFRDFLYTWDFLSKGYHAEAERNKTKNSQAAVGPLRAGAGRPAGSTPPASRKLLLLLPHHIPRGASESALGIPSAWRGTVRKTLICKTEFLNSWNLPIKGKGGQRR